MAIVSVVTILTVSLPLIPALLSAAATGQGWPIVLAIVLSWWAAAMVPLLLLIAYTHLFLFQFVVPIMYREGIGVLAAWGKFLALFRSHVLHFLAFGLFFIVLLIGVAVAIMVVGFSTCCVGFVLFALPYVSSVVLLPIDVLFRGLGPDFLAQFGPEWSIGERTTTEPPR